MKFCGNAASFFLSKLGLDFSRKRHTRAIYVQKYHFCKIPLYVYSVYSVSLLLALAPQLTNSLQVLLEIFAVFTIIIAFGDISWLYDIIIIAPGDICCLYDHHCQWKYLFVKQLRRYQDENQEK